MAWLLSAMAVGAVVAVVAVQVVVRDAELLHALPQLVPQRPRYRRFELRYRLWRTANTRPHARRRISRRGGSMRSARPRRNTATLKVLWVSRAKAP